MALETLEFKDEDESADDSFSSSVWLHFAF